MSGILQPRLPSRKAREPLTPPPSHFSLHAVLAGLVQLGNMAKRQVLRCCFRLKAMPLGTTCVRCAS